MIHWGPYEKICKGKVPDNAVTIRAANGDLWIIYVPTDKGQIYHLAPQPYVLGEGGRGSAKSTTLRWDAHLRNLGIPGYRALLLRRTFPQLRGSHFAQTALEGKALQCKREFNTSKFFLPYDNGSLLQYGHCENDAAIHDYLSQEWDWIGFDELTTFTLNQFIRIAMSSRTTKSSGKVALVRCATNPIGEGASWVRRYFIDHSVTFEENSKYKPHQWRDIKMNLVDNPHMDQEEYRDKLEMLPNESLRRAYIDGEWLVESQFFHEFRERDKETGKPWHVLPDMPTINKRPVPFVPYIETIRVVDWGYSELEPGWVGWIAMLPNNTALLYKEWLFHHTIPEVVSQKIQEKSEGIKIRMTLGDPMMWREREGLSIAEKFTKAPPVAGGVTMIPANNDRENGWVALHSWFTSTRDDGDGLGPYPCFQILARQPDGEFGCPYAIRTLQELQTNPSNPHEIVQPTGVEDHAGDGLRYWASNRPAPSHLPRKTLQYLPKELRASIYGYEDEEFVIGSESVQRHG